MMRKVLAVVTLLMCVLSAHARGAAEKVLVIPVEFPDVRFSKGTAHEDICNIFNVKGFRKGSDGGCVADYFSENLGGSFLEFSIAPKVILKNSAAYYGANSSQMRDVHIVEFVAEACRLAALSGVDFSSLDSDGDGAVDNIFLIFAGNNEAQGGGENTIWPQAWDISAERISVDGKQLGSFACCSEFSGSGYLPLGTICHEIGHLLGLVDMYDTSGETDMSSSGLYSLSVMGGGLSNNGGATPPYFTAVEREILGILEIEDIVAWRNYSLEPVHRSGKALRILTDNPGEYFLIENRQRVGYDTYIKGEGLVIYHIDKSHNLAGSMTAVERWGSNSINADASHPCVEVVDVSSIGDDSSFFIPGKTDVGNVYSIITKPLMKWNGNGAGIALLDIAMSDSGAVTFRSALDDGWDLPVATDCYITVNQWDASLSWSADRDDPARWEVKLRKEGEAADTLLTCQTHKCELKELDCDTSYECWISSFRGTLKSRPFHIRFTTLPQKAAYPIIGGMKASFKAGDKVNLNILNLRESPVWIRWYVNGVLQDEPVLTFRKAGRNIIQVLYSMDGANYESIIKIVTVE